MKFRDFILKFKARTGLTSAEISKIIDPSLPKRSAEAWLVAKNPTEPHAWQQTEIRKRLLAHEKARATAIKKLSPADRALLKV